MNNPPNPGIPALLLLAAQRMSWSPTGRRSEGGMEIGIFLDGTKTVPLRIAGGEGDRVVWALEGEHLIPHGITKTAFAILSEGTLRVEDNALVYDGQAYQLVSLWGGAWAGAFVHVAVISTETVGA